MDGHGPERRLGPGRDAIRHNERREIDSFVRGGAPEKEEKGAPNQTPLSCHPRSQPTAAHRGREGSLLLPLAASCPPPHKGPMIRLSCPSRAHPSSLPSSASGELVRLKRAICVFSSSPPPRRSLASEDACTYQDAPAAFPIPYTTLCLMTILIQQSLRRPWGPPPYIQLTRFLRLPQHRTHCEVWLRQPRSLRCTSSIPRRQTRSESMRRITNRMCVRQ